MIRMTRHGPPPKPTKLKLLEGNPGKRPLPQNEPKPKPIAPKCPSWLDKEAKKEWKRLAPELEKLGLLTTVDGTAMAAYCQAYSRWREAEEFITKHGTVMKTPSGYMQQLPHVSISSTALKHMRAFCTEFGLTPASRTRIDVKPLEGQEDLMEKLLRNPGG